MMLMDGTVPSTDSLLDETLKKLKFQTVFHTPSKPLLVRPQKFCPEVEGNPVPWGEPVVCNITTLFDELLLLGWELSWKMRHC